MKFGGQVWIGFLLAVVMAFGLEPAEGSAPYLKMPPRADGVFPPLLSETGAFADVKNLKPSAGLVPYDLIEPFWSDGAAKKRWISPGAGKIAFRGTGEWTFPKGTVFVKHFEMATDEAHPDRKRRLETRLLVLDADGGVYGATYKWRPDNSDADLLATNLSEEITIKTATGERTQTWYYPSRQDCLTCHTTRAGLVLGVKTRQLNRDYTYPDGAAENELKAWRERGLFATAPSDQEIAACPKLAAADDTNRSLEDRARSYLDANCAQCHRPGGTPAYFDARYDTPLDKQNLIDGNAMLDEGVDGARLIAPHDIWRSLIYMRAHSVTGIKMPPLAHNRVDEEGLSVVRQWIESLPGNDVVPPPRITPAQGNYSQPIDVAMTDAEPGAVIHYTLDGSLPTASDAVYAKPIHLSGPTILRAKAYKKGSRKSITSQEVFVIGN